MHNQAILFAIYDTFSDWSNHTDWACANGCSSCCTQNVSITAPEGQLIIDGLKRENRMSWLNDRLSTSSNPIRPRYTLNTMARACLAGKSLPEETPYAKQSPCPFLENSSCTIYPLRPFSCRSFLSTKRCNESQPAVVDEAHLAAATAVGQLLEHVGQRLVWGNMLDVLPSLLEEKGTDDLHPSHLLRAQPLPGFLIGPNEYEKVAPLIEQIFSHKIGDVTIEDVLNGNTPGS